MSANISKVALADGREVLLSYGVIVAAFIPRSANATQPHGYLRTDAHYSATTSKHANGYAGKDSRVIPDAELRALVAPVTDKRS